MIKEIVKYPLSIKGHPTVEFAEVRSPFSGEVVASVGQADEKAIDAALTQAKETFETTMKSMPAYKRAEILAKASELIKSRLEDLAQTIAREGGKPIKDARLDRKSTRLNSSH